MQIDGNFGGSAGIMEMLVQSHSGYIELLPAMTQSCKNGEVKGLRVRGGASVDFSWKNNRIQEFTLKADMSDMFILKLPSEVLSISGTKKYAVDNNKIYLYIKKGQTVRILF